MFFPSPSYGYGQDLAEDTIQTNCMESIKAQSSPLILTNHFIMNNYHLKVIYYYLVHLFESDNTSAKFRLQTTNSTNEHLERMQKIVLPRNYPCSS